jgi:hypothetical protein
VDLLAPLGSTDIKYQQGANAYPIHVPVNGAIGSLTLGVREMEKPINKIDLNAIASMEYTKDEKGRPATPATASRRHRLALAARTYLDEHQLLMFVQSLLQGLIRDRPIDPWEYINEASLTAKKVGVAEPYKPGSTPREDEFAPPTRPTAAQASPIPYHQRPSVGTWLNLRGPDRPEAGPDVDGLRKKLWGALVEAADDERLGGMLTEVTEADLQKSAKAAIEQASQDGTLSELADQMKAMETLRQSAMDKLLEAAQNGCLEKTVKELKDEANAPAPDMLLLTHKARNVLLEASETGKLTELLGEQKADKEALSPQIESLRQDMKNLLVKSSQDGSFEKVLADMRPEIQKKVAGLPWYPLEWTAGVPTTKVDAKLEEIRLQARKSLLKASADGSFVSKLEQAKQEMKRNTELQELQGVARNALFEAGAEGKLFEILQKAKEDAQNEAEARRKRARELLDQAGTDPEFRAALEEAADDKGLEFKLQPKTVPSSPSAAQLAPMSIDMEELRQKVGPKLVEACADGNFFFALEEGAREVESEKSKMGFFGEAPKADDRINLEQLRQMVGSQLQVAVTDGSLEQALASPQATRGVTALAEASVQGSMPQKISTEEQAETKRGMASLAEASVQGSMPRKIFTEELQLSEQICDKCGNIFMQHSAFCHKCGAKRPVEGEEASSGSDAAALSPGDEVIERVNSRRYTVTMTKGMQALLKPIDGSGGETWKSVSAVDKVPKLNLAKAIAFKQEELYAPVYEARRGDLVQRAGDRRRGSVLKRTTTDVLLQMEDGTEVWEDVEDLEEVLAPAQNVEVGQEVMTPKGKRGSVKATGGAEILVLHDDGSEEWHQVDEVGCVKSTMAFAQAEELFNAMDANQDGNVSLPELQNAMNSNVIVDGREIELAKDCARDALFSALVTGTEEDLEEAKKNAKNVLLETMLGVSEDDEELLGAQARTRDALITALVIGSDEQIAMAKDAARDALLTGLIPGEQADATTAKPQEPKSEPPPESAKESEAVEAPAPGQNSGSPPLSAAGFAELEEKIKQRNERFKKENDALRRENTRLKALLDKKQQGDRLLGENDQLRRDRDEKTSGVFLKNGPDAS